MMKIGSVAWGWTPTPEDMPTADSLHQIAKDIHGLGFDFVDYLCTREALDTYFTSETCAALQKTVKELGMWIGGVAFQSDVWNDPDEAAAQKQFEYFEKCLQAADGLGARTVSCIIPTPHGARYGKRPSPSDKVASHLPADYCWSRDWELFASNMKKAAQMAAKHDIRVAMECFPRSLCSTPDAMLTLLRAVDEPNFGIQLDTAHLMNQNIDIETAIFMLGSQNIFHIHAKDSDGMVRNNLAPGCGLIDYRAVLRALRHVGYTGNLSVEVEFSLDPAQYMALGLTHIRACIADCE